ncbi:MAG: redoxin domain-containing protein [Bacteroidales bacterium]|jgi:hypothetical protein|nr:redoxin domain-containing protein [Bacteroidales bacterium]
MRRFFIFINLFFIILISSLFFYSNDCNSQEAEQHIDEKIDFIDSEILFELVKESVKDFHLIFIYTDWCEPCTPELNRIDSAFSTLSNMEIYYVYPDKNNYKKLVLKYLRKNGINSQTFILSDKYKGNVKKRFVRFRDEICKNCDEILGFPSILILNKEYEVVYKHTGKNDLSEIIKILR